MDTNRFTPSAVNKRLLRGEDLLELHETPRGRGVVVSGASGCWAAHWFENDIETDHNFTFFGGVASPSDDCC